MERGNNITIQRIGFKDQHPALAKLYEEWYALVASNLVNIDGITLELGSGAGFLKEHILDLVTSDVLEGATIDQVVDAKTIGAQFPAKIANLILINVFHHINDSQTFLESAQVALKAGGRILMIEPACNRWSKFIYRTLNHEPFNPNQPGWQFESNDPLLDSNQAQSWIVFNRDYEKFCELFPNLVIRQDFFFMPLSYILTGGHKFQLPTPRIAIGLTRKIERKLLDQNCGLFRFIMIEKGYDAN